MARSTTGAQRQLTLTEELEKLEQSITLTLQEIDHNFSRAHRIVTSSILPVVEQYAEHSRNVWEGSKFWKQFFESSANVSLNGYEEVPPSEGEPSTLDDGEGEDQVTVTEDELLSQSTPLTTSSYISTSTPDQNNHSSRQAEQTPVPRSSATPKAKGKTIAPYSSPYSALRKQHASGQQQPTSPTTSRHAYPAAAPTTPKAQTIIDPSETSDTTLTPELPVPASTATARRTPGGANNDPLLHRVLDKNYRVQATPMGKNGQRLPQTPRTARKDDIEIELDLDSSPMEEAPELQTVQFATPGRKGLGQKKEAWQGQRERERVPGVSVLGEKVSGGVEGKSEGRTGLEGKMAQVGFAKNSNAWDSDEEDETTGLEGMSPPKTMQFHVPASKLVRTPAREASRRMVEDLLDRAGGHETIEEEQEEGEGLDSPSMIRRDPHADDMTF